MRIITNGTRDYYDTAGWMSMDGVFSRTAYDRDEAKKTNRWTVPFLWPMPIEHGRRADGDEMLMHFGACLIAGEIYPFARKRTWTQRDKYNFYPQEVNTYIYDADEVIALAAEAQKHRFSWDLGGRRGTVAEFMRTPKDVMASWCLDKKAITGILFEARPERHDFPYDQAHGMINCDGLGDRELFKILDPATAHMRIESYVSGVLPQTQDVTVLSDASKARKAGFYEMSFKTRPGTKKPRRQA